MGNWNSQGLRGSVLEELITISNDVYKEKGLALVQKVPTPIKPINIDQKTRRITLAFFEEKSTVDYLGVVQGVPVCFDAKETSLKSLPLSNIHNHQMDYMRDFTKQGGVAFIIVNFKAYDEMFLLPYTIIKTHWENAKSGGRKSIKYDDFPKDLEIKSEAGALVHYLKALQTYLMKYNKK